jgi:hypothetical protein
MLTFQEKVAAIEVARYKYITFEQEFREYTASGNSFVAAYNFFTIEDVNKHKELSEQYLQIQAWNTKHASYVDSSPVRLTKHSIVAKLEKLNDELNIFSRD